MINAPQLLTDLKRRLLALEDDLRGRISALPDLKASLQAEWQAARDANRTAETLESWSDQVITQAGVHWLLSCVFLRFIEDNTLVERPWIGGTPVSGRLALARDRADAYFREHPLHSDRDYLLSCFTEAGALPGLHTFFDPLHNPVFRLGISGDAAMGLRQFWQQVDPNTGALLHDFTDPAWNTRFLGDLYQDLSEATRKRYALLQTPEFVEEFILDRTLTPAIREFGYRTASLIDPTCGSGHFLLGAFQRFVDEWQRAEPSRNRRDIAQKALDAVAGVDLNPFAVAISRFRLLVAALLASDVHKLSEAPDFRIHVAIGDSLLHGKRFGMTATEGMFEGAEHYAGTGLAHAYASEDLTNVKRILGRQYHAVVGNPPYIVVKDAALNAAYRQRYVSCHKKYSLGCPFTERFFDLAVTGGGVTASAGFVGLITTNSFMKREFGSKLIEDVLPRLDLSHVIDSSGAWIPGHNRDGTATVMLFGRHRPPIESDPVRTVMGIKSEPSTPSIPAQGRVWSAIVQQVDQAGSESEFVSVADTPRALFSKHPWSIGGGGAGDLLAQIDDACVLRMSEVSTSIGRTTHTGEDNVFVFDGAWAARVGAVGFTVPLVEGEHVRDHFLATDAETIFPYDQETAVVLDAFPSGISKHFWRFRRLMKERKDFGNYIEDRGLRWYEHSMFFPDRFRTRQGIAFADIATHNHFVLDRGVKVFNRTAPVIKLPAGRNENEYLGLLGLLNSSVACFWLKQVCFPKDGQGQMWEERFAFNATNVAEFPLTKGRPLAIASRMDKLVQQLSKLQPAALLASSPTPTRASLDAARARAAQVRQHMIGEQEELDWHCYRLYELLPAGVSVEEVEHSTPVEVELGERAFEIVLARRVAAGKETTNWFDRHGSTPTTEIPARWPETYRRVVQRRIELIERDPTLRLLEQPLYKRRWNSPKWADLEQAALRDWLLARLESKALWVASIDQPPQINTTSRLADTVQRDAEFMQIAALYAGHADFDLAQLVAGLVTAESVPFLPALRYSDTGLRKRAQWEDTWALQRREDKGESIGKIPVPPKYKKEDFVKVTFWDLRGGLDVPKERWVSYPGCERGADGSLPIAWAGWDHLQQATALAAYYLDMKDNEGWPPERLQPLLAGLLELVPWLEQWHNEVDPVYGERMGAYYKSFVSEEARTQGFTIEDLRDWKPAMTDAKRGRKKKA
ncbi:MAG: BREX-2 system adenine-specific DNA-methyltransferase PglX [Desulfuromonadaceae bacterium]